MFGLGLANAYVGEVDIFGGVSTVFLVALATRLLVGIGWFFLFRKANKTPYYAFIPLIGPYTAFRLVWDDFSFAAIFAGTTFIAFVDAIGLGNSVIRACADLKFVLWWIMALLTAVRFQTNMIIGFVYGSMPWFGSLLIGLWPSGSYKGPWSSDPDAEQNLSSKERKKRRKKAAKAAKQQGSK